MSSGPTYDRWQDLIDIQGSSRTVLAYGAKADGTTNSRTAIQNAINATPANGTLILPPAALAYNIGSGLTVSAPITIIGYGATLHLTANNTTAITIASHNVTIRGLTIVGARNTTASSSERGIYAVGATSDTPWTNIKILECDISVFGQYGINLRKCEDVEVRHCYIHDVFNAGISFWSVKRGFVCWNRVQRIVGTPLAHSYYGIAITRDQTAPLSTDDRSYDVMVSDNLVTDNPGWDGINTHGGVRCTFTRNIVLRCAIGIDVVNCPDQAGNNAYAPIDCIVSDNIIDSGRTDGGALNGITFAGATNTVDATVVVAELATGIVRGNIVRGHGDVTNSLSGAIYTHTTRGLTIDGNVLEYPSPHGIVILGNSGAMQVNNNTFTDPWNNQSSVSYGIWVKEANCNAGIIGNTFGRGLYTLGDNSAIGGPTGVTAIYTNGIRVESITSILCRVGMNWTNSGSTILLDSGARTKAPFSSRIQGTGLELGSRTVTGNTTALATDHIIYADATSAGLTVTLPQTTDGLGREYVVVKTDATGNAVTVAVGGGETINGAANKTITTQYESLVCSYQQPNYHARRSSGA